MMVANSFDLWQKDAFFTAAEEVQQSADIMESAYRNWARQRREGLAPKDLNELCRELQTAFGTAKWQLEEFEKAVKVSYGNRAADDLTRDRHRQFVIAIENQIAHVEAELEKFHIEEGKQPLRWVNLDEEERDDLAMFLSGTRKSLESLDDRYDAKLGTNLKCLPSEKQCIEQIADLRLNFDSKRDVQRQKKGLKYVNTNMDDSYVIEVATNESPETSDSSCSQADRKVGTRRNWSTPNFGSLSITIDAMNDAKNVLMSSVEATPKEKGTKPIFWKPTIGDQFQAMRGINRINQLFRLVLGRQRQLQTLVLQRNRSFQLILALMIAALLIVPFAFYST
ncbi:hypothetical protein ACET3Z_023997 [Daucus carota]